MRVLIYGAGALGQGLGCLLATAGHQVDLVIRPRYLEALRSGGLRVAGIFGEFQTEPGRLGLLTDLGGLDKGDYDAILLTTKTYDTAAAVEAIAGLRGCRCPVVSMQNGCGNLEKLVARLGQERSLAARVITGFEIERPGLVRITVCADAIHVGGCRRGEIPSAAVDLAEALSAAGHPCIAVDDIHRSLFAKLLYNCALNPLGALLGVHYGALGESEQTRSVMDQVINETFAVITAMGGVTPWPDATAYRDVFYGQLLPATCHHRPSMLQDLENNKLTEVEAMVGYVSAQGRNFRVPTPCCQVLAALVRFKEQQARAGA